MPDQLVIERLEFQGHCGVSQVERAIPQPLAIDVSLEYPEDWYLAAARNDDISRAIDYSVVARRIVETGSGQEFNLLEALADRIVSMLFTEFPIDRVGLWLRKMGAPIKEVQGSVGVRLDRARERQQTDAGPAIFLLQQQHRLPKGHVLDIACGAGRNALYLASQGYSVHGIDRDTGALTALAASAERHNLPHVTTSQVDLEVDPRRPPDFSDEAYDSILVFYYLYRPLFPAILRALKPGGVLMYETFLIDNHLRRQHPRRREFCLGHNELLALTKGLRVLHYAEGEHQGGLPGDSAFTTRLIAQKEAPVGSN